MSEQRTHQHLLWELHHAEREVARRDVRITQILNREARLILEVRRLRLLVTEQPNPRRNGATP